MLWIPVGDMSTARSLWPNVDHLGAQLARSHGHRQRFATASADSSLAPHVLPLFHCPDVTAVVAPRILGHRDQRTPSPLSTGRLSTPPVYLLRWKCNHNIHAEEET